MLTLLDLPDSCTTEDAVRLVSDLAGRSAIAEEPPSLRTLRLWRTKGLLSKGGRRFTRRNLLEVLGILRLRSEGMTSGAAADRCRTLDDERLFLFLTASPVPAAGAANPFAEVTLQLLAKGFIEQHRRVGLGAIVGVVGNGRADFETTPLELRQASARLGRLFFEEGHEDVAASLHALIVLGTTPLRDWAPRAIWALPDAADAILVDPDYLVPSEDCEAIAQQAEGASLDDLIENRLHRELMETVAKLGHDANSAYSAIREFVGRHPLATARELKGLYARAELPMPAIKFAHSLFAPVHTDFAVQGQVRRCRFCMGLVGGDGRCSLQGCREDHSETELAGSVAVDDAFVARPEVLKYWVDPAREELRLYDALRGAGYSADLYPHADRCDVALGDEVGVDVKDYREPARLARRLNRTIGGLALYPRAILAVADRRARGGDYLARLREQLTPETQRRLEVRSVTDTIHELTRDRRTRGRSGAHEG